MTKAPNREWRWVSSDPLPVAPPLSVVMPSLMPADGRGGASNCYELAASSSSRSNKGVVNSSPYHPGVPSSTRTEGGGVV